MKASKIITTLVGLAISAIAIWYALRAVDLGDLWSALTRMNWLWGLPCLAVAYVSFIVRAWRWQVLLAPTRRIGVWALFGPLMVGFGFNSILPARLGEFLRPLALSKTEKVPFATGFSTVFVERVLDVVILLSLAAMAPVLVDFDQVITFSWRGQEISPDRLQNIAKGLSLVGLVLLAGSFLMLIPKVRDFFEAVVRRAPLLPERFKDKLCALFHAFADGFNSLKSPKMVVLALFQSALVWWLTAWSFVLMSYGVDGLELSMADALVFTMVTCIAITLPAAPGYWGLYELGGKLALVLSGVVSNTPEGMATALGFTLVVHFIHWGMTAVVGLWYAGKIHVRPSEAGEAEAQATDAAPSG